MPESNECKGCSSTVRLTQEEIQKIFGETVKVNSVKVVTEEVYQQRLERCSQCQALDYGTTCRYCGCLIQVKAKLLAAKCPYPYEPRW